MNNWECHLHDEVPKWECPMTKGLVFTNWAFPDVEYFSFHTTHLGNIIHYILWVAKHLNQEVSLS